MTRRAARYGWIPDLPDHRDHRFSVPRHVRKALPRRMDMRRICPPVYDQGSLGRCHDDQTEVLTDTGWKLFKDVIPSDRLASVNPKTVELIYEYPTRLVRFAYNGPMYCIDNQSLNFKLTPDHKMLVRKWNERERTLNRTYEFVAIKDIGWYRGLMNRIVWKGGEEASDTYILRGVNHKHIPQRSDERVPMGLWLRFLGIYLAEGTMLRKEGYGKKSDTIQYGIQIAACKPREKDFVRQLLHDLGVRLYEREDRFVFYNRRIFESMEGLGLYKVKAPQKFVPEFVFQQSSANIKEFLLGHFMGDGCEDVNRSHYTSSTKLTDDLQRLIFLSGDESRISTRDRTHIIRQIDGRNFSPKYPENRIRVCENKNLSIDRKKQIFQENYDGEVFCAEVPTYHTLITRRKGKILISGNCSANAICGAIEFERLKQKLPDFVPRRLFVYWNEREIEGTVDSDSGAMLRDGIKSVARQGACPESEWPYDIARFTVKPTDQCYADAKKDLVRSYRRLDQTAEALKGCLAQYMPFVFGIRVFERFERDRAAETGIIPMPSDQEQCLGGHALMCVGFSDQNSWFIFRNRWNTTWGDQGYGYLPYAYMLGELARDFWNIQTVRA